MERRKPAGPGPSGLDARESGPLLLATVGLGLVCAVWSFGYDRWQLPPRLPGTFGLVMAGDVLPMLLMPLAWVVLVLRRPLDLYGLRWPGWKVGLGAAAVAFAALLPFVAVLSGRPEFQAAYPSPQFPPARSGGLGLGILWLLHHGPQLFALEFLMRGFLLQPLARRLGLPLAVLVTGVPYVLLHAQKPPLEWLQAAVAAAALGWAAWRTRSCLPAFAAHWAVAVSMDALCLLRAGPSP